MLHLDGCLLDSNILLRMEKQDDPEHSIVGVAMRALPIRGLRPCFTSQALAEFWNVSTRPRERNGFGLTVLETERLARVIEEDFKFLPDSQQVHERWRELLVLHQVKGAQVHDTRLVASMNVYGLTELLTFNVRDFRPFEGIHVIHPVELSALT